MHLLAFKLGTPEIILILFASFVLFGRRLPALGYRLGVTVVAIKGRSLEEMELWFFIAGLLLVLLWLSGIVLFVFAR